MRPDPQPEPPRRRVGDRLEKAIEHHADVEAELARGEQALEREPAKGGGSVRRMVFWLARQRGLALPGGAERRRGVRLVAPDRAAVARVARAMALLQAAALACLWIVQRLSMQGARWQPVIASQLAGNALAKIAPGGGAMGAALQYRMLVETGMPRRTAMSGLTASNLLLFGVVLALPVLAIPAILRGGVAARPAQRRGGGARGVRAAVRRRRGAAVLRPAAAVARPPAPARPQPAAPRCGAAEPPAPAAVRERDRIVDTLGPRWKRALAAALGRWAFDFGCLLAALRALDAVPRPGLVLLAFCAAQVLAQIPLTPGGLGFVEAGLTATLTLAGVPAGTAVVATFAYRLFAYWLQLPLGLVGLALQRAPARRARLDPG